METVTPKDDGMATFVLDIIMLVICIPTVVGRFMIRGSKGVLGLDDWLMGLGMAMTVAWSGILIVYCFSGGGYSPTDPLITPELMARALKFYFICQSFYCATTVPIKISICVALLRITGTVAAYRWALYAIMAIATISGIGSMIGIVVSCTPPSAFWDPSTGTCNAFVNTFAAYFVSACSILTDFALAILPALMLWKVQLQKSIKVSVGIILGLAAVASCATIVRLRYLLALLDTQNFLLQSGKIAIWTVIELGIGIFAGSVPALRPLLRYVPGLSYQETGNSHSHRPGKPRTHVKMNTLKSGTYGKAVRDINDGNVMEDGDSQEFILHTRPGNKKGIRKDVSVTVESSQAPSDWNSERQYNRH